MQSSMEVAMAVAKTKIALPVLQAARADAEAGKHKSAVQNFRRALAMGGPGAAFAEEAARELAQAEEQLQSARSRIATRSSSRQPRS